MVAWSHVPVQNTLEEDVWWRRYRERSLMEEVQREKSDGGGMEGGVCDERNWTMGSRERVEEMRTK